MAASMKQVVVIEQDTPKVKIQVEVDSEAAGKRILALETILLNKITMASHGYAQADLPELNDPDRQKT